MHIRNYCAVCTIYKWIGLFGGCMSAATSAQPNEDSSEVLGTAEELGVPVFEGIDPSEVVIYEDGSHEGPAKHKYRFGETVEGYDHTEWTVVSKCCPCGHHIRETHAGRQYNDLNWGWAECDGKLNLPGAE